MPYTYIMTNKYNTVLYVGVTNDIRRRYFEHLFKVNNGFTKRYNLDRLVYYECFEHKNDAIAREKSLKGKTRDKKIALIKSMNPEWKNLMIEDE